MIIAVDFDGTCVTHEYPKIGKDIGAVSVLKKWVEHGHKLILWTMRAGKGFNYNATGYSKELEVAVSWLLRRGITLWGVNENPEQFKWSTSPKAYAHLYIDDAALGCPLIVNPELSDRPFVDWSRVDAWFQKIEKGDYITGFTDLIGIGGL